MASPEIERQLYALRLVNDGLRRVGVWLLYELLVPAAVLCETHSCRSVKYYGVGKRQPPEP